MKTLEQQQAFEIVKQYNETAKGEFIDSVNEFKSYIEQLINETPTGEVRNTYTNLNILFHDLKNKAFITTGLNDYK